MSQLEEAVACLAQARSKLAPITERLLDIETRLAVVGAGMWNGQPKSRCERSRRIT